MIYYRRGLVVRIKRLDQGEFLASVSIVSPFPFFPSMMSPSAPFLRVYVLSLRSSSSSFSSHILHMFPLIAKSKAEMDPFEQAYRAFLREYQQLMQGVNELQAMREVVVCTQNFVDFKKKHAAELVNGFFTFRNGPPVLESELDQHHRIRVAFQVLYQAETRGQRQTLAQLVQLFNEEHPENPVELVHFGAWQRCDNLTHPKVIRAWVVAEWWLKNGWRAQRRGGGGGPPDDDDNDDDDDASDGGDLDPNPIPDWDPSQQDTDDLRRYVQFLQRHIEGRDPDNGNRHVRVGDSRPYSGENLVLLERHRRLCAFESRTWGTERQFRANVRCCSPGFFLGFCSLV